MKRFTKIAMAIILTLAVCITFTPAGKVEAKSKNIRWFAGDYRKKIGNDEYYILDMQQYTSYDGGWHGQYGIHYYYKPSGGMHLWKNAQFKKVHTNKYKAGKMIFKVYKNKIVITKGGKYNGTYKLKKRYPMP